MLFLDFCQKVLSRFYALTPEENEEFNLNKTIIQESIEEVIRDFKPYMPYWASQLKNMVYVLPDQKADWVEIECWHPAYKKFGHVFHVYCEQKPLKFQKKDFSLLIQLQNPNVLLKDSLIITSNFDNLRNPFVDLGRGPVFSETVLNPSTQDQNNEVSLPDELINIAMDYCVYKLSTLYPVGKEKLYERYLQNYFLEKEKRTRSLSVENWLNKPKEKYEFPEY